MRFGVFNPWLCYQYLRSRFQVTTSKLADCARIVWTQKVLFCLEGEKLEKFPEQIWLSSDEHQISNFINTYNTFL